MNSGTSRRDYLTPMGCEAFGSVITANLLVARSGSQNVSRMWSKCHTILRPQHFASLRSILLIAVCICMDGTPVVENPGSSMIWLHDRFQWLLAKLETLGMKEPVLSLRRYHFS